jgi:hypothetical protein
MFSAVDLGISDHGERTGSEQATQIAVALLADTAELVPAATRVLLRYEPDPRAPVLIGIVLATRTRASRARWWRNAAICSSDDFAARDEESATECLPSRLVRVTLFVASGRHTLEKLPVCQAI